MSTFMYLHLIIVFTLYYNAGMLKEEYVPEKAPLDKLREVGALPVVDYAFSLT